VRVIVPFAPGGGSDVYARLIGQWLSERLGQQFIVESRPGAGSNIGTEAVVRAPADGYTLLLVNSGNAASATLGDRGLSQVKLHEPGNQLLPLAPRGLCRIAIASVTRRWKYSAG